MVLPFFMLFIVFLATIIRIAIADMALYQAVSETNEVIATHAYPADLATTAVNDIIDEKLSGLNNDLNLELDREQIVELFNNGMNSLGIEFDVSSFLTDIANDAVVEPIIRKKFAEKVGGSFFDPTKLKIDSITPPSSFTGEGAFIEIDVSYDIDIVVPFVDKTITLKKTSYERLWAGA